MVRQRTTLSQSCRPFHPLLAWMHQELASSRRGKEAPQQKMRGLLRPEGRLYLPKMMLSGEIEQTEGDQISSSYT